MKRLTLITILFVCISNYLFAQSGQSPTTLNEWNVTNTGSSPGERLVATINSGTIGTYTGAAFTGQIIDGNGNWGNTLPIVANFKLYVNFSSSLYDLQQDVITPGVTLELKYISATQVALVANCSIANRQLRVFLRYTNGTAPAITMGSSGTIYTDGSMLIPQPTYINILTGRLALNTTSAKAANYTLAVGGKAIAEEVNVAVQGDWPDYVFAPAYQLTPLTEVKSYIDQNRHLPEIPSELEVAKDGLNLGQMNKLLMKKVEELTLYAIENEQKDKEREAAKDKLLASLQQQINALKRRLIPAQKQVKH